MGVRQGTLCSLNESFGELQVKCLAMNDTEPLRAKVLLRSKNFDNFINALSLPYFSILDLIALCVRVVFYPLGLNWCSWQ